MKELTAEEESAFKLLEADWNLILANQITTWDGLQDRLIRYGWRKRIPKASQLVREAEEQRARADAAEARADEAEAEAERLWDLLDKVRNQYSRPMTELLDKEMVSPAVARQPNYLVFEGQTTGTTWNTSTNPDDFVHGEYLGPGVLDNMVIEDRIQRTQNYHRPYSEQYLNPPMPVRMPPATEFPGLCNNNGGQGIGAGHVCMCALKPHDELTRHGCSCGAEWAT